MESQLQGADQPSAGNAIEAQISGGDTRIVINQTFQLAGDHNSNNNRQPAASEEFGGFGDEATAAPSEAANSIAAAAAARPPEMFGGVDEDNNETAAPADSAAAASPEDFEGFSEKTSFAAIQNFADKHPASTAFASTVLYYVDLGTDLAFVASVINDPSKGSYGILSLMFVCVCPVVLSIADMVQKGGMGWKGVLLNLTCTRMIYTAYRVARPTKDETAISAGKANTDFKLLEALLESVPQLYVQFTALFTGVVARVDQDGNTESAFVVAWLSITISLLSIAYATTAKYAGMLDIWDKPRSVASLFVYFLADASARALAVALVAATMNAYTLFAWAFAWLMVDVAWQTRVEDEVDLDYAWDSDYDSVIDICCSVGLFVWYSLTQASFLGHAIVSFFTAMPLSTNMDDLIRMAIVSGILFFLVAVIVLGRGYNIDTDTPHSASASALFSNLTWASGAESYSGGSGSGSGWVDDIRGDQALNPLPAARAVLALLSVKIVAYVVGIRNMGGGSRDKCSRIGIICPQYI